MASPKLQKLEKHPGVYKRGYRYVAIYRDRHGKQHKAFGRTIAEAKAKQEAQATDSRRGEDRTFSRITFDQYAPDWIKTYSGRTSRGFREDTHNQYDKSLNRHAIPFFNTMMLTEIAPRDIKAFIAHVGAITITEGENARKVSASTVRHAVAPVKCLLADAFEEGLIRTNPAVNVRISQPVDHDMTDVAPGDEEKIKALTPDELSRLLEALPQDWKLFFEFLAHTGLRISEALALQWRHVSGDRVQVRRRYYRGGYAPPKSKYGRRDVPLSPAMAQTLWTLRRGHAADELVFPSTVGTPINQGNLATRALKPAARSAGLAGIFDGQRNRFHVFRHTCATMLFTNGMNAKQVQVWLGHHSPAFTVATYVHLLPEDLPTPDFLDTITTQVGNKRATEATETGRDALPVAIGQ